MNICILCKTLGPASAIQRPISLLPACLATGNDSTTIASLCLRFTSYSTCVFDLLRRCVCCVQCGSNSPGFHCEWQNNYTHCGPCASLVTCPVCRDNFMEEELLLQCQYCDRWVPLFRNTDFHPPNEDEQKIFLIMNDFHVYY